MKLIKFGAYGRPELSCIYYIYLDKDANKYYSSSHNIPDKYILVHDETYDFMLFKRPEHRIKIRNPNYKREIIRLFNSLKPIQHIDFDNKKITDYQGVLFDLYV